MNDGWMCAQMYKCTNESKNIWTNGEKIYLYNVHKRKECLDAGCLNISADRWVSMNIWIKWRRSLLEQSCMMVCEHCILFQPSLLTSDLCQRESHLLPILLSLIHPSLSSQDVRQPLHMSFLLFMCCVCLYRRGCSCAMCVCVLGYVCTCVYFVMCGVCECAYCELCVFRVWLVWRDVCRVWSVCICVDVYFCVNKLLCLSVYLWVFVYVRARVYVLFFYMHTLREVFFLQKDVLLFRFQLITRLLFHALPFMFSSISEVDVEIAEWLKFSQQK